MTNQEAIDIIRRAKAQVEWDYPMEIAAAFDKAIEALAKDNNVPDKNVGKWISVKDRMPELGQEVLVYAVGKADGFIGEHDIEICNRYIFHLFPTSPGYETWSSPRQYFHSDYEITHWMLLPEPPKE